MLYLSNLSFALSRVLMLVAAVVTVALACVIVFDIVSRTLGTPVSGTKELVANSIVIVVFLQLSFAVVSGSMLRADFLASLFGGRVSRVVAAIGYLVGIAVFATIASASWEPFLHAWTSGEFEGEGAIRVPTWPSFATIIACCWLVAVNYLLLAIAAVMGGPLAQALPEARDNVGTTAG